MVSILNLWMAFLFSTTPLPPPTLASSQAKVISQARVMTVSHYGELPAGQHWNRLQDGTVFLPQRDFIAAHPSLPIGTRLMLTRLDNPRRSIVVTVLDRGPFVKGRDLDISTVAAHALGVYQNGVVKLQVQIIPGTS